MLKLIRRLFFLSSLLLIAGGVWAFNNGMTADNYQEFITDIIEKYQPAEPIAELEEKNAVEQKKKSPSSKPKKKAQKAQEQKLLPLPKNPFATIDKYARNATSTDEIDVPTLANYLQQKAQTDLEKARAIYVWIAENIRYDDESFNSKNYPLYTPQYLLENRKAVCEGYSNLYLALGLEMGLDIEKIIGYSKGYGYQEGTKFTETSHAWNIIKINGEWKVFDATWGRGFGENVGGKLKSIKKFNDYWFNVSQYEAIFNHYPESEEFHFVKPAISLSQYERMPTIDGDYFALGFDGKEAFLEANSNPNYQTPQIYSLNTHVRVIEAPKVKHLSLNQAYDFEFHVPRADKVAMIDAQGNWTYFQRDNGIFSLTYTPTEEGKLQISIHHDTDTKSFDTVLAYEVKENGEVL